jgi:hypothetical protein
MIVREPLPLCERMARPDPALAIATGAAAACEWAWKRRESAIAARLDANYLGDMETFGAPSGLKLAPLPEPAP